MKTVILAAGFGSRLWPLSTSEKPKQFQPLIDGESPLSYTHGQLLKVTASNELYVLGLEGMQGLIYEVLPDLKLNNLIIVPERRNTLPHTLWALASITDFPDEPVLFKSVDHFIVNPDLFEVSLSRSLEQYASNSPAVTLLCTAFKSYDKNDGYCVGDATHKIVKFLEKPTELELKELTGEGTVYRSPMIYIASKQAMVDVLGSLAESWVQGALRLINSGPAPNQQDFLSLPMLDISSTVFQKSPMLRVSEIEYEYIDVGQFAEVYLLSHKDSQRNAIEGNVILGTKCHNCLIINKTSTPLVVMSQTDTVIVQTRDGSLVTPFNDASKIGDIYKTQIHGTQL